MKKIVLNLILVLLLALYGLWGGLEGRARVYEIIVLELFFFLLWYWQHNCQTLSLFLLHHL